MPRTSSRETGPATVTTDRATTFLRPPTAQEAVKGEILRRITAGEIRLGDVIRQETIAKELGLSQAPVREALKVLVGMGVVIYEPHHGHRLREFSESDLREIYRLRTMIEAEVLRESVNRMTDDVIAELDRKIKQMEALDPSTQVFELKEVNESFHMLIFNTAKMPYFVEQIEAAWSRVRPYRSFLYNPPAERRRIDADHRAIVDALRVRDADEVIRLHDLHRKAALAKFSVVFERMRNATPNAPFDPDEPITIDMADFSTNGDGTDAAQS